MAKAELQQKSRPDVVLTLSYDEASVLKAVVGSVGGSEVKTLRRYTEKIYDALNKLALEEVPVFGVLEFYEH